VKRNTLTTVSELKKNDIFCRPNYAERWKVITDQANGRVLPKAGI